MKIILFNLYLLTAIGIFTACSGSYDPDNPLNYPNAGKLQVKVAFYSSLSGSAWGGNQQIGIFVGKNTAEMPNENPAYANVLCTGQGADTYWQLERDIQLPSENNTVFAYYPYKPVVTDWRKIDVDISKVEDICFGINDQQTVLNRTQPVALITMRHALAKIRFNLIHDKTEEYSGPGIIENARVVKLTPNGKVDEERYKVLTIKGTLDVTTGRISTVISGKMPIEKLVGKTFTDKGFEETEMPFFYSAPESDMKEYAFALVIDGKQHILRIDNGTEWRASTINTYTFRLKGATLIIDQDNDNGFNVKPWEGNESGEEIDY